MSEFSNPRPSPSSAVTVSKLGYVGFQTPDVARLVDYYTRVLDFVVVESDPDRTYLTTGFDHHCIVVEQGALLPRTYVGYELWQELDEAQRLLSDAGYEVDRRSDIAPSTPDVLVLNEPMTGLPLHLYQAQASSGIHRYTPLRPTKLGHLASYIPDLTRIRDFYEGLLGFRWADTVSDFFVFLRCNRDHHTANFLQSATYQGMHHIAYEMRDVNHLQTMIDHLSTEGYRLMWGPGRHGPGHNVFTYHRDPDGNMIELFTELDVVHDEAKGYWEPRPWHDTLPSYPRTWEADDIAANRWGPLNPGMIDH